MKKSVYQALMKKKESYDHDFVMEDDEEEDDDDVIWEVFDDRGRGGDEPRRSPVKTAPKGGAGRKRGFDVNMQDVAGAAIMKLKSMLERVREEEVD